MIQVMGCWSLECWERLSWWRASARAEWAASSKVKASWGWPVILGAMRAASRRVRPRRKRGCVSGRVSDLPNESEM